MSPLPWGAGARLLVWELRAAAGDLVVVAGEGLVSIGRRIGGRP